VKGDLARQSDRRQEPLSPVLERHGAASRERHPPAWREQPEDRAQTQDLLVGGIK
jgi:hypothetical protein